jgi:hypothetical protein
MTGGPGSGRSGSARPWRCPPISDRRRPPAQALNFAKNQSRGYDLDARQSTQAVEHDPQVGQVAALEQEFVVDIADEVNGGPHSRNGPEVLLEHLAWQAGRQPDPGDRLHRAASRGVCRNTGFGMIIRDHGTKSSRAASTSKAC